MVSNILNTQAMQMGADLMGHFDIPHTPFTAFGLLQWFQPNTRIQKDPLDFTRYDLGVQWLINKYLRVAFDSQAIQYYHSQFAPPRIDVRALEGGAVRSCARHARILPAPGIQILATIHYGRCEHAKCSRRPHHVPQNTSCETGSPDLCVGDADFALCVRGAERDTGSTNRHFSSVGSRR